MAAEATSVPIIGNGDIWSVTDIENIFDYTNCHSIMLGRGALKTPWLAPLFKMKSLYNEEELLEIRKKKFLYTFLLLGKYSKKCSQDALILKRFKSFSRNIFDDFPQNEIVKRKVHEKPQPSRV